MPTASNDRGLFLAIQGHSCRFCFIYADGDVHKGSGQETVPDGTGHRLLPVYAPPAPQRGEDNTRPVFFDLPSTPENPRHNIIPSGLCNKSPRAALVSASHTIRIMLRSSVLPSKSPIPPVRSARRQERSFPPGPSPALARHKTPHLVGPRPQDARPYQGRRGKGPESLASW